MMEVYRCFDGRDVVLTFRTDALKVRASSGSGENIGSFQFELVGPNGKPITLKDYSGEVVSLRLARSVLLHGWRHQGIAEHVSSLVTDVMSVAPVSGHVQH